MGIERCQICGAEVRWIRTSEGNMMQVDAEPIVFVDQGGRVMRGYASHAETCPGRSEAPRSPPPKPERREPTGYDLGKSTMPFGKHKGMRMEEVPLDYLDWLLGQEWFTSKQDGFHLKVAAYLKEPAIAAELESILED